MLSKILVVLVILVTLNWTSYSDTNAGALRSFLAVSLLCWASYKATRPSPLINKCGSPGGPLITSPRIKLRDGQHLAYKDHGVPNHKANHKFIFKDELVIGFVMKAIGDALIYHVVIATSLSTEIIESMGIYIVSFDRPVYGESDLDPNQTLKSLSLDIEELADQLKLGSKQSDPLPQLEIPGSATGSKFYIVGLSMGAQLVWACLKYIPHRLAGATLLTPVVNYWWHGLPASLSGEAYKKQPKQDQWALHIAHYAPWLTYWWNTRSWFPPSYVIARNPDVLSSQDKQLLALRKPTDEALFVQGQVRQHGEYESLHRALMIGFGDWEFDPTEIANPFPEGEGSVHLWQGDDDKVVPMELQRYIAQKLPWLQYHEIQGAGHLFPLAQGVTDAIIKAQSSAN